MKIEARLALSQRQRRFEWALARDEQARTASRFVAGKTHDLLNLVQIVQLACLPLGTRCDPAAREFLDDISRAATDAQHSLNELMELARPDEEIVRGAPVAAAMIAAIAAIEDAIRVAAHVEAPPEAATRCTAEELEHLVIGLGLDALDAGAVEIELFVRERAIGGAPWIEIVRGSAAAGSGERFELRVVEAIAARAGGELATSERRGGGQELVVALPIVL